MSGPRVFLAVLILGVLLAGCPGDKTTNYYITEAASDAFPGTPVSASNLAEDAKALSPGGQDVVGVKVFWNGHDRQEAVVLFETRVLLGIDDTETWDKFIFFHHLWATSFNGTSLTKPVELLGKDASYLQVTEPDRPGGSGGPVKWKNLTDTAHVVFYRSSTAQAFGALASSADAQARENDAVIFFRRADLDTATGVTTGGIPKSNDNTRLYYTYFDSSQADTGYANTPNVVGSSTEICFRYGFMEEALPISDELTYSNDVSSRNDVRTFGVLCEGAMGQCWWSRDENDADNGATFTHFLVAVWTEITITEANQRGIWHRYVGSLPDDREIDIKLMSARFDLETGLFGAATEIALDTTAAENAAQAGFSSPGDSVIGATGALGSESFLTYDNQIFFTYSDGAVDNDPASVLNNYTYNPDLEAFDTVLAWNIFEPASAADGSGAFLANSLELSPANRTNDLGVLAGGSTANLPDLVNEITNTLDNKNEKVLFGAHEGLGATYIFFSHYRIISGTPDTFIVDDADLFTVQIRHDAGTGNYFTAADDRIEMDTGADAITVVDTTDGGAMDFTVSTGTEYQVDINSSSGGTPFDAYASVDWRMVTFNGEERLAENQGLTSGAGFRTDDGSGTTYYDLDFTVQATAASATFEAFHRGVLDDWRVVLNKSSEYILAFYRQQNHVSQSMGLYGSPSTWQYSAGDTGLYVSRLSPVQAGGAPQSLSTEVLAGADAKRLDENTTATHTNATTLDPTSANHYRNDVIAFKVQSDLERPMSIQSSLDRISVAWLCIDDDNPLPKDARNTYTTVSTHSHDVIRAAQVENSASALTVSPAGGAEVTRLPFSYMTNGDYGEDDPEDTFQQIQVCDSGVDGECVIYHPRVTASEILVGTTTPVYQIDSPAGVRLYAANFDGTSTVSAKEISTPGATGEHELVFFLAALTRGIGPTAVSGTSHLLLWIESRGSGGAGFYSGGALRALRYNKAVPETGATASNMVTAASAWTPDITSTTVSWPFHVDFDSGDSISFPMGFGAEAGSIAVYFSQFGEIYYNYFDGVTGAFFTDADGLPAPVLVSNDEFGSNPGFFQLETGIDTDMFTALVDGNYMISTFTGTVGTQTLDCVRYDNRTKALVLWGKDDGGWDPLDDGTGFHRLLARIHD